ASRVPTMPPMPCTPKTSRESSYLKRCCRPLRKKFLQRVAVGLASADAQRMIDRRDEDLAVADLPGARLRRDDLHRLVGDLGGHRDLDPQFGQEVHDIFGAAIDFGMALLTTIALDLGHGHAVDADLCQRLADLVQLEGFDDRDN